MKCYLHIERDAIGICSVCGKGICTECAVSVGGKLYCKQDVEKGLVEKASASRSTSITVASILLYIFGALGIILSLFVIGLVSSYQSLVQSLPSFYSYFIGPTITLLFLVAIISLIISILDIVAGYWLWLSYRKGGILAILLSVVSILLSIPFFEPISFAFGTLINLLIIILVLLGWNTLK